MAASAYDYMAEAWKNRGSSPLGTFLRQQAIEWRKQPSIKRVERPTRLDRARGLGYKAKQGFVIVRVRVRRGGARKKRPVSGRRQRALGVTKYTRGKSLKLIAEERAARRFPNLALLNSYYVWEDGKSKWFEAIMVDPNHPSIRSDKDLRWLTGGGTELAKVNRFYSTPPPPTLRRMHATS